MEDRLLITTVLQQGYGRLADIIGAADSEEYPRVLDEIGYFVRNSSRTLALLLHSCSTAREQMEAVWQPIMATCCRALPPGALRQVMPHFRFLTDQLRKATARAQVRPAPDAAARVRPYPWRACQQEYGC